MRQGRRTSRGDSRTSCSLSSTRAVAGGLWGRADQSRSRNPEWLEEAPRC